MSTIKLCWWFALKTYNILLWLLWYQILSIKYQNNTRCLMIQIISTTNSHDWHYDIHVMINSPTHQDRRETHFHRHDQKPVFPSSCGASGTDRRRTWSYEPPYGLRRCSVRYNSTNIEAHARTQTTHIPSRANTSPENRLGSSSSSGSRSPKVEKKISYYINITITFIQKDITMIGNYLIRENDLIPINVPNTVKPEYLAAIIFGGFSNMTIWQRIHLAISNTGISKNCDTVKPVTRGHLSGGLNCKSKTSTHTVGSYKGFFLCMDTF